jgi:hypothetical protein
LVFQVESEPSESYYSVPFAALKLNLKLNATSLPRNHKAAPERKSPFTILALSPSQSVLVALD